LHVARLALGDELAFEADLALLADLGAGPEGAGDVGHEVALDPAVGDPGIEVPRADRLHRGGRGDLARAELRGRDLRLTEDPLPADLLDVGPLLVGLDVRLVVADLEVDLVVTEVDLLPVAIGIHVALHAAARAPDARRGAAHHRARRAIRVE